MAGLKLPAVTEDLAPGKAACAGSAAGRVNALAPARPVGHEGWERLDCTSWDQLRKRQWRPGGRGLVTNHEFLEIKSMVSAWSNILTSGSNVRGALAAALLTISAPSPAPMPRSRTRRPGLAPTQAICGCLATCRRIVKPRLR